MLEQSSGIAMLNLNPDIVCNIIAMAKEFHAKEAVVFPDEAGDSDADWAMQVLADHKSDPIYAELKSTIEDLEPDQQVSLVALMWVGREDFDVGEWDIAYEQAGDSWTEHTADYVIATPMVADYLGEGLYLLGHECEG